MSGTVTFFIPLGIGSNWENNELRYLLRSLEKNFQEDFKVVIYSDDKLDWIQNVDFSIVERQYPDHALNIHKGTRHYENYFSVLYKIYDFVNSDDCPEEFVYTYDDVLLVKKITSQGIINYPECKYDPKMEIVYRRSKHGRTILKSFELTEGTHRYEHHLPMVYNRDRLLEMFSTFKFWELDIPYALGTLYFNLYREDLTPLLIENNYKAGFEGFDGYIACYKSDDNIKYNVSDKTWVNYNDTGLFWNPPQFPLQKWMKDSFPYKSKFEK